MNRRAGSWLQLASQYQIRIRSGSWLWLADLVADLGGSGRIWADLGSGSRIHFCGSWFELAPGIGAEPGRTDLRSSKNPVQNRISPYRSGSRYSGAGSFFADLDPRRTGFNILRPGSKHWILSDPSRFLLATALRTWVRSRAGSNFRGPGSKHWILLDPSRSRLARAWRIWFR